MSWAPCLAPADRALASTRGQSARSSLALRSGGTVNGSSLSLRYDGHGRRISREVAGARTDFWHDATGLTLETGAASATYLRDSGGLLLSVSSGGSLSNYGRDRLGTITALTSASQTLTNTYRYDPWGQAIGGSGSAYNPFQYTATYKDAATGLYQMGARYYQPASGRFTQLDPSRSPCPSLGRSRPLR